jgi:hypothetical protein
MRGVTTAMAVLTVVLAAAGCVENEQSFYIEHVKVLADPPGCESSSGDAKAASAVLDLALAEAYFSYFYVTNGTMVRKEHDNLRAESDGILIDGMEVYVTAVDGSLVGGSEYYQFQMYLGPDSSDIAPGYVIPSAVVQSLADGLGCTRAEELAQEIFGPTQSGGPELPAGYFQDILAAIESDAGSVYSVVRFLGHTQGGNEVETNEYSFLVQLCCNCMIEWQNCATGYGAYCEAPATYQSCNPGVISGGGTTVDCRLFTYGLANSWTENGLPASCASTE